MTPTKQRLLTNSGMHSHEDNILNPSIMSKSWLHLSALNKHIKTAIDAVKGKKLAVLDVGCGTKPYIPMFNDKADKYIGIDMSDELEADIMAVAENLPFISNSFDTVIATQTMEHVNEPNSVVSEIYRVLKKDGKFIMSTHGVWMKHTSSDNWRWTDQGLKKLLSPFKEVAVMNSGGSILCLFQILNLYISRFKYFKGLFYLINNILGKYLDGVFKNDSMVISYVAIATK